MIGRSRFSVLSARFAFRFARTNLNTNGEATNLNTNGEVSIQKRERLDSPGFTLIELMIVMALIVILAGIGLAVHANSQTRAREAVLKEDLFRMRDAIDQYYADKNAYPASLDALVTDKYLRAVPIDPFTNSAETWQTVMSEQDAANPSASPGIFDVKSGSERTAMDGKPYADW